MTTAINSIPCDFLKKYYALFCSEPESTNQPYCKDSDSGNPWIQACTPYVLNVTGRGEADKKFCGSFVKFYFDPVLKQDWIMSMKKEDVPPWLQPPAGSDQQLSFSQEMMNQVVERTAWVEKTYAVCGDIISGKTAATTEPKEPGWMDKFLGIEGDIMKKLTEIVGNLGIIGLALTSLMVMLVKGIQNVSIINTAVHGIMFGVLTVLIGFIRLVFGHIPGLGRHTMTGMDWLTRNVRDRASKWFTDTARKLSELRRDQEQISKGEDPLADNSEPKDVKMERLPEGVRVLDPLTFGIPGESVMPGLAPALEPALKPVRNFRIPTDKGPVESGLLDWVATLFLGIPFLFGGGEAAGGYTVFEGGKLVLAGAAAGAVFVLSPNKDKE